MTITPEPEAGYVVDEITITGPDGNPVEVTDNGDGTWSFTQPGRNVTVSVTFREESEPEPQPEPEPESLPFLDMPEGAWYAGAIRWAASEGIAGGYGNGLFGSNDSITREQMAAMLYRFGAYMGFDVTARADLSGFTDAGAVSGYAAEALAWACGAGIVNGAGNDTLDPGGTATWAQVAAMLMRFCQQYMDP